MSDAFADTRGRAQALRGHAAMLGFSAAVSGSFSLGVMVANDIPPVALTAARFLLASAVLALLVVLTGGGRGGRHGFSRADLAQPWRYGLLAVLYGGYFVLMFEGLKTAHPVSAGAVFTLTPLMTALIAWPLLGQRPLPYVTAALAVGAAGAVWVIFRGDPAALARLVVGPGETVYFLGCVAHAVYTPLVRRLNRGEPAVVFTFGMLLAGALILGVWGWGDIVATDWAALPAIVWITLGYIAVFASAMTFVLLQYATLRLPAAKVMAYTYLTPSWVLGWEVALGGATPPGMVLAGFVLTVVALLLLLRDEG